MGLGIAQEARGKVGRIAERERGKIGGRGERGLEQPACFRRFGEERGGGSQPGIVTERLDEAFDDVGAARRVIDAWSLGDALDEPLYADLVSDPACS
jgi:hypothetical protein